MILVSTKRLDNEILELNLDLEEVKSHGGEGQLFREMTIDGFGQMIWYDDLYRTVLHPDIREYIPTGTIFPAGTTVKYYPIKTASQSTLVMVILPLEGWQPNSMCLERFAFLK
jgi:hypothetical protein